MIYEDDEEYDYWFWLDQCGFVPGYGCTKAGSEECDWECPFRDQEYLDAHKYSELKDSESN